MLNLQKTKNIEKINKSNNLLAVFLMLTTLIFTQNTYSSSKKNNCINISKQDICIQGAENSYGELTYLLYVNQKKYPEISYYDNAIINKIKATKFKVTSSFSTQGNTEVTTTLSLKNGKPFIHYIKTSTRINESPAGSIENCKIQVNEYFLKNINTYVDDNIFNIPENQKYKICSKNYN
jgi:hypothetical protein